MLNMIEKQESLHRSSCRKKMIQGLQNALLFLPFSLPALVSGQTDAFTRQETCPNDGDLTGYTSIANLNDDMAAELDRVIEGGEAPAEGYNLILCPGQDFDVTGGNAIRPIIDQVSISCGGTESTDPVCRVVGSEEQLIIEDSSVQDYTLSSVRISGLTFSEFGTTSATLTASAPTVFTCADCAWQDFDGSEFVVDLSGTMTTRIQNGLVGFSEGETGNANVNEAVFNVMDGQLEIVGLSIREITTQDVFRSGGDASLTISDTDMRENTVQRNLGRVDRGLMEVIDSEIDNNRGLDTLFLVRGENAALEMSNTAISNNRQTARWTGINAARGSTVTVRDSRFEGNEGLEFGIVARGNNAGLSNVLVERSSFVDNVAFDAPNPTGMVASIGNDSNEPSLTLQRIDFEGNSGFVGNFLNIDGNLSIQQACFTQNSNTLVGFQSKNADPTVFENNFIGEDEASEGCGTSGLRHGVEQPDSEGCFLGDGSDCQVNCEGLIADSDVCLSQVVLTDEPSAVPSLQPTRATAQPSETPSARPSEIPSQAPSIPPFPGQSEAPTLSLTPTGVTPTLEPTAGASQIPTEVEITASPFMIFPTPVIIPPLKPPVFRPDCYGKGRGKGRGKGFCPKKKKKKKKKVRNSEKLRERSRKNGKKYKKHLKKSSKKGSKKESEKIKKFSKSGKSDRRRRSNGGKGNRLVYHNNRDVGPQTWETLGGAQGVYRNYMAPAKSGGPRRNLEEDSADLAGIGNELYEDYENIFNDIFEGDYEYGPFEEEEDDDDSVSNAEENEDDDSDDEDDSSKYDIEFVTNALNATTIEDLEPSLAEDGYRIQ